MANERLGSLSCFTHTLNSQPSVRMHMNTCALRCTLSTLLALEFDVPSWRFSLVRIRNENLTHKTFVNRICRTKGHASKMLIEPEKWDAWSWIQRPLESKQLVRSRVALVNLNLVFSWVREVKEQTRWIDKRKRSVCKFTKRLYTQTCSYRLFWNRHFYTSLDPTRFLFLFRLFQFMFFSVFHLLKVVLRYKTVGKK